MIKHLIRVLVLVMAVFVINGRGVATPIGGPTGYTLCASENGTCSFTGTASVAYGANGQFNYQNLTGGTLCANSVFGDPIYGVAKACYTQAALPPSGGPTGYTFCSSESGTCSFTGTMSVAFGANGQFNYKNLTGGTSCTNTVFGDPIYGVAKSCYTQAVTPPPSGGPTGYTFCASENGACAFTGTASVAFGANGAFNYKNLTGGTPCTNVIFGDPIYGVAKSCYTQSVTVGSVVITTASIPGGMVGLSYQTTIATTGGTAPYTFSISGGSLPPGLSLASSTGMIYGTPIVSGVFPFTIQVVDSENPAALATHPYTIAVVSTLAISTASLPAANIGVGYTTTITATGGVVPYTFAVTNGSLPAGLPLNSATGVLAGTPTTGGAFNFTLTASDSAVPQDKSSAPFLIVVGHTVIVQWTASITPGVSYNVYSGITSGGPYTSIGTTSALNFRDPTSTAGNTYYYVVTAFDTNGESGYSNEASAVIPKP